MRSRNNMSSKDSSGIRVFAGLPLPDRVAQRLYRWTMKWRNRYRDWRVSSSHVFHITLHFFGDISALEADRLAGRMDDLQSSSIQASLAEVGCFPEKGPPRVLFVGIDEGCEEIKALYVRFHELIRSLGYRKDKREFVPHITIARRSRGVGGTRPPTRRSAIGRHAARLSLLPNDWRSQGTLSTDGSVSADGVRSELDKAFTIDRLVLYESRLKPDGAEYIPLKQILLL